MTHKVMLAVRALNIGGAERQFLELVKKIDHDGFDVVVVTLREGTLDAEIAGLPRVRHVSLQKRGRWDLLVLWRYARLIRSERPDVVYSFMFDMNVFSAVAVRLARSGTRLVWGIFGSEPDFSQGPRFLRSLFVLKRWLEGAADVITSDSVRGFEFLRKYGFALRNPQVVFSGTDSTRFAPNAEARAAFRREFQLADGDIAVGIASRLVHMKGYPVLAQAARDLVAEFPTLRFFAIGYGDDRVREESTAILGEHAARFTWLGKVQRPEVVLAGWDIYCSSSLYGEGFSNSIIEAMSCSLPVVATDVGDAAIQVGPTGVIVPPGDAGALRAALRTMILDPRRAELGRAARQRVLENFSAERMVRSTEDILRQLATGSRQFRNTHPLLASTSADPTGAKVLP